MAASFIGKTIVSQIVNTGRITARDKVYINASWRHFMTTRRAGKEEVHSTQNPEIITERDPFPVFLDKKVQELLHHITGFDVMKVAGPQKKPMDRPAYKLLTDAELAQEVKIAKDQLKHRLQIPPYMNARKENLMPLSVDPDLAEFDTTKYVFTDISFGVKDRHRNVVVRQTDGTLVVAPWKVKDRMNEIYNPREGREYLVPKMFEEQNIEKMISEKKYLYILDRSCCQFEPDDPDFIRVTHRVYNAINSTKEFDILRSTRHFGSLAFYLAWNHMIDHLLLDMMNRDLVSDTHDLVSLYCIIHPESQCAMAVKSLVEIGPTSFVKVYIETESKLKGQLELALQAMEDAQRTKQTTGKRSTS